MTGSQALAIAGVVAAGLGFANIWPMLFSITVEEKPERANELSGLMCMAISGGAIVPLLMGKLVDMNLKAMAFVVPAACFAYLLLLSLKGGRKPAAPASNLPLNADQTTSSRNTHTHHRTITIAITNPSPHENQLRQTHRHDPRRRRHELPLLRHPRQPSRSPKPSPCRPTATT